MISFRIVLIGFFSLLTLPAWASTPFGVPAPTPEHIAMLAMLDLSKPDHVPYGPTPNPVPLPPAPTWDQVAAQFLVQNQSTPKIGALPVMPSGHISPFGLEEAEDFEPAKVIKKEDESDDELDELDVLPSDSASESLATITPPLDKVPRVKKARAKVKKSKKGASSKDEKPDILLPDIDWHNWPAALENDDKPSIEQAWKTIIYEDKAHAKNSRSYYHCLLCVDDEKGGKKRGNKRIGDIKDHILGFHMSASDKKLLADDESLAPHKIGLSIRKNNLVAGLLAIKTKYCPAVLPPRIIPKARKPIKNDVEEEDFTCKFCDKTCKNDAGLKHHVKMCKSAPATSLSLPEINWEKWPTVLNKKSSNDALNLLMHKVYNKNKNYYHCLLCVDKKVGKKKVGNCQANDVRYHILVNHIDHKDKKKFEEDFLKETDKVEVYNDQVKKRIRLLGSYIKSNCLINALNSLKKKNCLAPMSVAPVSLPLVPAPSISPEPAVPTLKRKTLQERLAESTTKRVQLTEDK